MYIYVCVNICTLNNIHPHQSIINDYFIINTNYFYNKLNLYYIHSELPSNILDEFRKTAYS